MSPAEYDPTLTRREFMKLATTLGFGVFLSQIESAWGLSSIENPLAQYPQRDWEHVYRDLYRVDSTFSFLCAPNDTHNCLLEASVKNGVLVRINPTFGYGKATDLYGNTTSARWDPRCCQKGLALVRRFYGDRRVRGARIRLGFKKWVDQGFPREPLTKRPPAEFFNRGFDRWVSVSWDEATSAVAKTLINVAKTYQGDEGAAALRAQGYDEHMIAAMQGAGTQVLKFRGGMPLLGQTRVFGMYRLANSMALLDYNLRGVSQSQALGARGWDNYSWHTDLPPGHTMVTGQQTVDFDLNAVEHAKLVLLWGMNWICTKMPDAHWLTEARLKGTKVVVIACEYSASANKGDEVVVVRPGTTPALALGFAHVLIKERLYDEDFIKRFTDLPLLVRMDTLQLLRATDLDAQSRPKPLTKARLLAQNESPPAPAKQREQWIAQSLRDEWGDFVVWSAKSRKPVVVTRDDVGGDANLVASEAALEARFNLTLADGKTVEVATVFDLIKQYLKDYTPETVSKLTWAPQEAIVSLAHQIAKASGATLFTVGMGPNQFFNNDLKDRSVFLVAALSANIGKLGGNVGSYAGNYRTALFDGIGQYINEDPFAIELDPEKPAQVKRYWKAESAHYYNHDDHYLKVGNKTFTGKTHIPTPTKTLWFANANSILGNVKWHYHIVTNVLPKFEMVAVSEWWWSPSCEWADVVFGVDSWAEFKHPDMCASVTNSFLTVFPRSPLPRIFDTRADVEVQALVARQLAALTGERRFEDYWRFVLEERTDVYLQRILSLSRATKGYRFLELEEKAKLGVPALMMNRTTPRVVGYEQDKESKPWYTKTGRLEFYREEPEFIGAGENLPVYREPIDSTFYEPNVIVSTSQPALRPEAPAAYGLLEDDLSCETRQVRNVVRSPDEVLKSQHALTRKDASFRFIFHTPKYRHGAHTTPIDTDICSVLFGPFGDVFRHDKRSPFVTEGYVDINPNDAKELGVDDGDYVWIDADPQDRPFRGWQNNTTMYRVARLLARARYYPGTPRGITRMWFNMYGSTPGSMKGQAMRPDGLAKNPETGYQALFRSGSHQSATRGWLKPTLMTDSLARKDAIGQVISKGFEPDVHCPTGAPRESFVKITRAEPGGLDGKGLWRPVTLGIRPLTESDAMKRYLAGDYVQAT